MLATEGVPEDMYPNPNFVKATLAAFPEKAVATIEESRALWEQGGYYILDVRSDFAYDQGKVKGERVVHVPRNLCKTRWDSATKSRAYDYTPVADWKDKVSKAIPDKKAKILVMCADGRTNAIDALEDLDALGYSCIVGMKGGYGAYSFVFDNKGARRVHGEYKENYSHGADTAGIHASGAGFAKMDPKEAVLIIH
ncbi:unnamed protein product [Pedinophyceae sp. YPF-701]|nr:unnamed protein product [Pedinophyceae sp. YPF-701]